MHRNLRIRHRVLIKAYMAYIAADRDWQKAARDALNWLPATMRPDTLPIGDPGSRIRRFHDRREAALERFIAARGKLETARARLLPSRRPRGTLLIGYIAV